MSPYRHAAPLEMTILAGSIGHAFDVRVQRVQRVVLSPSRAMSFIGLPGRPTPSTTGVVPLPLQAGGGKFTGERPSPAPLGSVSLDSQSHTGSLRIQFPCHREWGRRKVYRGAVPFTPAGAYL